VNGNVFPVFFAVLFSFLDGSDMLLNFDVGGPFMKVFPMLVAVAVMLTSAAEATTPQYDPDLLPEPRPLGRDLATGDADLTAVKPNPVVGGGEVRLRRALARALLYSPQLSTFSWEIRAREAEALQAGLLPNPEFGVELENFSGSGVYRGTDQTETTAALSQLIQLGGKRKKSRIAATLQARLAGWDFETARLDVLTSTTKAFVAVLAAQMMVDQADELAALTEKFFQTVVDRVEAGESSPVERTRAQVTLSASHVAQSQARLALDSARMELAALWGDDQAHFDRAVGSLGEVTSIPPRSRLTAFLEQNPDLARWETEEALSEAQLSLERANAIPDLTLAAGIRNLQESDDNAFVAGFFIPIPIFDRNQGGIAAARAERSRTQYAGMASRNRVSADLATAYRNLSAAFAAAEALQKEILPAASLAFESIDIGFRAGKFSFLEVLDAQRTLFEVKGQYIEALAAYHQAKADVERLIGAPLHSVTTSAREEN